MATASSFANRGLLRTGQSKAVKMLLDLGADTSLVDSRHTNTPLIQAASGKMSRKAAEYLTIITDLLDAEADVKATDRYGHDALYHAISEKRNDAASLIKGALERVKD